MKNKIAVSFVIALFMALMSACTQQVSKPAAVSNANLSVSINQNSHVANESPNASQLENQTAQSDAPVAKKDFIAPISNALSRITKKPFGIYITPKNSPVQPERFTGYHTGVDFETTSEEAIVDVPISAACSGKVRIRQYVSGYGGVLVQDCVLSGQSVTVLYGHLNLASISPKVGSTLNQGDFIGNLGQGDSQQTDGERKHLHLGIHKGTAINYKGYVSSKDQLIGWIDAQAYL